MHGDAVTGILLPASLMFIMFSLGLGLSLGDFKRIVGQPKALLVGVLCHFILLPLICYAMLRISGIEGAFAVGFMIVAACPTGSTSNMLTYLARGDVALAVSFTAVASVLTMITLPFIVTFAIGQFMGSRQIIAVPAGVMVVQIFSLLALPVGLGMSARRIRPILAQHLEPRATKIATFLFIVILIMSVAKNWRLLVDNFAQLAPFAISLNVSMLLVGFGSAWLAGLSRRQSITLGIESAMQNAALALVVGSSLLHQDATAIPGAVYGVIMYVGGLLFAVILRRISANSSTSALH